MIPWDVICKIQIYHGKNLKDKRRGFFHQKLKDKKKWETKITGERHVN